LAVAFERQLSALRTWTLVDLALATGRTDEESARSVLEDELAMTFAEADGLVRLMMGAPAKYGAIYPAVRVLLGRGRPDLPLAGFGVPCDGLEQVFGGDAVNCDILGGPGGGQSRDDTP
jgi:hypothetical protein